MRSRVTYLFNPMADDAVEHLADIANDYHERLTNQDKPDALTSYNTIEKEVETMRALQDNFNYNGVQIGHFNKTLFVGYTSSADVETARDLRSAPVVEEMHEEELCALEA